MEAREGARWVMRRRVGRRWWMDRGVMVLGWRMDEADGLRYRKVKAEGLRRGCDLWVGAGASGAMASLKAIGAMYTAL